MHSFNRQKLNKVKKSIIIFLIAGVFLFQTGCSLSEVEEYTRHIEKLENVAPPKERAEAAEKNSTDNDNPVAGPYPEEEAQAQEIVNNVIDDSRISFEEKEEDASKINDLKVYSDDEIASGRASQSGKYAYEMLGADDKVIYTQMYLAMDEMADGVKLSTLDEDKVNLIYQYVMMDHPELFWINGYTYIRYCVGEELTAIGFRGYYSMDSGTRAFRQSQIDTAADNCLASAPGGDDYSKIKYIYEYIILNTEYDINSDDNQNICSVLLNGRSVCQGYAKTTQYLLQKLGIRCVLVSGTDRKGGSHSWNLVYADGAYYYVDTTWGDASFQEENVGKYPSITYDYLCASDKVIFRTHQTDGIIQLPVCTAVKDYYYVREGAYFSAVDAQQLAVLFDMALSQGKEYVTINCVDGAAYDEMKTYLLTDQHIFDYLTDAGGRVSYFENVSNYSLSFWL